jgi:nucleotide-binding universal stress UspA family protein
MATHPCPIPECPVVSKDVEKEVTVRLKKLGSSSGLSRANCHVRTGGPVFDDLCRLAGDVRADLIVMPTHGRTGLKHVFLGSTAERVVQHSPVPVLVARKGGQAINKILVPVDFSGCSLDALKYAIQFAESFAAEIVVLHAVYLGYIYSNDGSQLYDLGALEAAGRKNAERQMREFVSAASFGQVKYKTSIRVGLPVDEICAFAKEEHVDLIITSTHGRTGFKHVLMGSVAEQIVRHAGCPVLVVPSNAKTRLANLTQLPARREIASPGPREEAKNRKARPAITNKRAGANGSPFPERRKTNKFRQSHLKK